MEFLIVGLGQGEFGGANGLSFTEKNLWQRPDERIYGRILENADELIAIPFAEITPFQRHFITFLGLEVFFDNTALEGDFIPTDKTGELGFWVKTVQIPVIPEDIPDTIRLKNYVLDKWLWYQGYPDDWASPLFGYELRSPAITPGMEIEIIPLPASYDIVTSAGIQSYTPFYPADPEDEESVPSFFLIAKAAPTEDIMVDILLTRVVDYIPAT